MTKIFCDSCRREISYPRLKGYELKVTPFTRGHMTVVSLRDSVLICERCLHNICGVLDINLLGTVDENDYIELGEEEEK
jgi:hypothetical protein